MHGRSAEPVQGQEMLSHRIALVPGKAVARIPFVQPLHARVARGLGEDGGRGDRLAFAVSLHDGMLGYAHVPDAPRIDQQVLCRQGQRLDRSPHRQHAGPVDVDRIDLVDFGKTHRIGQGRLLDLGGETIACGGIELLGIVDAGNPRARREHHRGRRHRTRKGAHARFVDAGHAHDAGRPQAGLIAQQLAQALALGAVVETTPGNGVQDRPGPGPGIGPQRGFGGAVEGAAFDHVPKLDLCQ